MPDDSTYFVRSKDEVLSYLETGMAGLATVEARQRLKKFGANRLTQPRAITFWGVFKEEFTEPMILLLLVVGLVYSFWGERRDAITIFIIIATLVFVEIGTEYRAKKSVAALKKLTPPTVPVMRGGRYTMVPTEDVVKGDILVLELGEKVPADARIVESFGLEVDESPLTGEATPVDKEDVLVSEETSLADRKNMVFAGTTVTRGKGTAVVTATAMDTELGRITGLVIEAKEPKTPLQLAMKQLAGMLVWVAVTFSVLVPFIGWLQGKDPRQMVLTGLSMSFATIPEELPIVVTMVLGVGAYAMARRNVLVRRLRAAETLGGVTVIATDKTGTITANRLTLSMVATDGNARPFSVTGAKETELSLLKMAVLSSGLRNMRANGFIGDPVELAMLRAGEQAGISPSGLDGDYLLKKEFSFDNQRKIMSVTYQTKSGGVVFVKGAPEAVLERSSRVLHDGVEAPKTEKDEQNIRSQADNMAAEALRLIAVAYKKVPDAASISQPEAESGLVFAGIMGLADPPRPGVKEALEEISAAGVRTIVVSGDHPLTVEKVAAQAGIVSGGKAITGPELSRMDDRELRQRLSTTALFARTTADQKLRIVSQLRQMGEVVAVTGDGINDAPALKSADIGIAMGETGTEVARETADMVLRDDSFISIVAGVREGRKIFDNLKKGISYYLCVKVALVLSFVTALALSLQFPFAPIQIILLELFMDLAASATFVVEPVEPHIMSRPPRSPRERFVNREMLQTIAIGSVCLAGAVMVNYLIAWYSGWGLVPAQTLAFATWLIGHIFLAFNMRSQREPLWKIGVFSNPVMVYWAAVVFVFIIVVTSLPVTQASVKVTALDARSWAMAVGVPFVTVFWMELRKLLLRRSVSRPHI